ncbi:hypothetical protein Pcar_0625 [Syntrophotalea carbinolica DSM 2380]|uniref:Class I SAM-dependent methyltransferase n=1 Tax=Syntrophotalea carbinolica (strain DSM 2380 / NBRC 103641 / GraBd1) TaxID=338963 RepID=Q3A6X3_SYNC1|nr:class I SAM-dependent methyltransferase [Syntrophotalea carbinolica]ABA87884.1 hypothetical protein Pcar_0625 [Syntrophotalea carbinolica DSM 2380]
MNHIGIVLLYLVCILGGIFIYVRLHKMHGQIKRLKKSLSAEVASQNRGLYEQLECLIGLYRELDMHNSLPLMRGWAGSPDFLWHLARHARRCSPRVVVECGSGVSTVVLARCMQLNGEGHVYSMDHDPVFAEKTRREIIAQGLEGWATVLDAPLQAYDLSGDSWLWYASGVLPQDIGIDMLVVDGPPDTTGDLARYPAGPILLPRLNRDGTVFMDDYARSGESAVARRWRQEWPDFQFTDLKAEKGLLHMARTVPEG